MSSSADMSRSFTNLFARKRKTWTWQCDRSFPCQGYFVGHTQHAYRDAFAGNWSKFLREDRSSSTCEHITPHRIESKPLWQASSFRKICNKQPFRSILCTYSKEFNGTSSLLAVSKGILSSQFGHLHCNSGTCRVTHTRR